MNVASALLLDEAGLAFPEAQWLIIGGEADLVRGAIELAPEHLVWIPYDVRELEALGDDDRVWIHRRPVESPGPPNSFDIVLIPGVNDRDLNRRSLMIAKESVRPSGWVLAAGANNEGVRSFHADGQALFSDPFYSSYQSKHRIATFEGVELTDRWPGWASQPGVQPGTWLDTGVILSRFRLMTSTTAGVFAAEGVDEGTRMLLDHLEVEPGHRVLDVGTGSGIIGAVARQAGATVTMTDVSLIATAAARRTMTLNEADSWEVRPGDVYAPVAGERFDLIVSNPPFHRGRNTDRTVSERLITEAPDHLVPGGSLVIVANGFLPYNRPLTRTFRRVETLASTRRFRVYRASDPA